MFSSTTFWACVDDPLQSDMIDFLQASEDRLSAGSYSSCIPETPSPPLTSRGNFPTPSPERACSRRVGQDVQLHLEAAIKSDKKPQGSGAIADLEKNSKTKWLEQCPITGLPIDSRLLKKLEAAPQVTSSTLRNTLQNALGWKNEPISRTWDRKALIVVS